MNNILNFERYLIGDKPKPVPYDDAAESSGRNGTGHINTTDGDIESNLENGAGSKRRKWTKEEKKMRQGSNKGRRFGKVRDELDLCWKIATSQTCEFGQESVQFLIQHLTST